MRAAVRCGAGGRVGGGVGEILDGYSRETFDTLGGSTEVRADGRGSRAGRYAGERQRHKRDAVRRLNLWTCWTAATTVVTDVRTHAQSPLSCSPGPPHPDSQALSRSLAIQRLPSQRSAAFSRARSRQPVHVVGTIFPRRSSVSSARNLPPACVVPIPHSEPHCRTRVVGAAHPRMLPSCSVLSSRLTMAASFGGLLAG
jgi:hypothetical protein